MFTRYAAYFAPAGEWGDFGAAWLGWDIRSGVAVPLEGDGRLDHAALVERPRKYGFHATLKAPFRLEEGACEADVLATASEISRDLRCVALASLQVSRPGRFFALTAPGEDEALRQIGAACVTRLDAFRAPLTDAELVRRRKSKLSSEQDELLVRWGYPHVMDQFRFHMTLTGPAKDPDAAQTYVADKLETALKTPLVLDALTIAGEREDGAFEVIERFPFGEG